MKLSRKFEERWFTRALLACRPDPKGNRIPYIAHLLGVAAWASVEYARTKTEGIGALLMMRRKMLVAPPGSTISGSGSVERVATIVEGCTDTLGHRNRPGASAKKISAHLKETDASTRLVSAADKLFNVRSILRGYANAATLSGHVSCGGKKDRL